MGAALAQDIQLQTGDIVFRESSRSTLSGAIDDVTQTDKATHFSHMGIIERKSDTVYVLHAAPENGSERISLKDFIEVTENNKKEQRRVVAYRLKPEYQSAISDAIENAYTMLGKPYNFSYVMNDSAYYCSDFVYRSYAKDSIFVLNPMTFINPETGEFHEGWISFYKELDMEVPEGKPGCNPNGMAASDKIYVLGEVTP